MPGKCGYSYPGTYGDECGKPATFAQQVTSELTADRRFWCLRCAECVSYTGPDNDRVKRDAWQAYRPGEHKNKWTANRWPNPPEIIEVDA